MRKLLFLFAALPFCLLAQVQQQEVAVFELVTNSTVSSTEYLVTIDNLVDAQGTGLLANDIVQDSFRLIDESTSSIYEVTEVISSGLFTAELRIVEQGSDLVGLPGGKIVIYRKDEVCDIIRLAPENAQGLPNTLISKIHNHNLIARSNCGSGSSNNTQTVTLAAHGYTVLDAVYYDTLGVVRLADTINFADGFVKQVLTDSTFVIQTSNILEIPDHGKDVGKVYYAYSDGQAVVYDSVGQVNHALYKVLSEDKILILRLRPFNGSGNGSGSSGGGGNQDLSSILGENTSAGNNQITDLADPVQSQDAATKAYVDDNDDVDDADADPNNEIELPSGGSNGQILSTDGAGNYTWIDDQMGGGGGNGSNYTFNDGHTIDFIVTDDTIVTAEIPIQNLTEIQSDTLLSVRNDSLFYTVKPQGGDLNNIALVEDYTAFRASSFDASIDLVFVSDSLLSGQFFRSDQVQEDDGGIFISDSDNNIWKRGFTGDVSIDWYGAISGDDDANKVANQTAISAAIDAGRSLGREILIPAGLYFTNEVSITEGNFTLKGVGKGLSVLKAGAGQCATCALIEINEFSNPTFIGNMVFRDFSFDGNEPAYVGQVTQERELLNLRRVENVTVLRCEFRNGSTDAIDCDYEARTFNIISCNFINNQRIAIHSYGCVGCRFENNLFVNNNLSTSTVNSAAVDVIDVISGQYPDGQGGTAIVPARDVLVKNNTITFDTTILSGAIAGVEGIVIDDCINCTVEENNINGIRFLSGGKGVGIKVGTGCQNFIVRDNTLADIDGIAVWVVAVTGDFGNIENTSITKCSIGIKTAAVRMIEGGKIEGATAWGVEIQTKTTLKNVEFLDSRGVVLLISSDSTVIQNCTFKNMKGNAISVDRMAYILNNTFEGNTTNHCINFNNAQAVGTVVKGNSLIGFRRSGIRIPSFINDASNPVYIVDNTIDGRFNDFDSAQHDGISLDGFHVQLIRNTITGCRRGVDPVTGVLSTTEYEFNKVTGNTTDVDLNIATHPFTAWETYLYNAPETTY